VTAPTAATATATIVVVGVGPDGVDAHGHELLSRAALVAGGERQLDAHAPPGAARVRLAGDLRPALDAIAAETGPVVVLASGDPGFFGIVRALAERFGRGRLQVLPGVSSIALAFARAGLPWDDALVVSAHGRDPTAAVNAARAHPKVAVLTAPDTPAPALARALRGSNRRLVVAARLGEPDEEVVEGTAEEIAAGSFADPHVLLVLDEAGAVAAIKSRSWPPRTPPGWALPEAAFEHRERMITKAEVRALALARLGPGTGDLVWDIGAHSGSVAIECARFGAAAVAIEREPDLCELVGANAARHGVSVEVVCGEAPGALVGLPDPDAVFVGGGGTDLPAILAQAAPRARRAVVVALAAVERVAAAGEQLEAAGFSVETTLLQASRLQPLAGIHRLAAENPVFVVAGARR
jgi:precorrin-6B C5,15-methyltransferase / cobalt-precorrin-6B C5,C15-methyltransferase